MQAMWGLQEFSDHYKAVRTRLDCAPAFRIALLPPPGKLETLPMIVIRQRRDHCISESAKIIEIVAEHFAMHPVDLCGPRRYPRVIHARWLAAYLMRERLSLSFPQIGARLGKDHTTVLHACRRVPEVCARDADLAEHLAVIESLCDARGIPDKRRKSPDSRFSECFSERASSW